MQRLERFYVACWCFVMPVTGTLLIPSVQGTIPAYMMAFGSVLFVLMRLGRGEVPREVLGYFKTGGIVLLIWLFLFAGSQIGDLLSHRTNFSDITMIDPNDVKIVMRTSMFTQSIYLAACVLIAMYFRYFFKDEWLPFVFAGGFLLAIYGIYEWTYFLVFHQAGDFLVNRTFGESEHIGSWSQGINFGPISLLRIKSTLGEPTFFAGVVLPYLFFALNMRQRLLSALLLFTALFSTSTACYLGLGTCLVVKSVWSGRVKFGYVMILLGVATFLAGIYYLFPDTFANLFGNKFSGDNDSGRMRLDQSIAVHDLFAGFTPMNWLFGVGFGYVYQSIMVEILMDCGVMGLGMFLYTFFRPIILLPLREGYEGLKLGLLAITILFSLSLSELFLPTTWMFLGLAYRMLAKTREERFSNYGRAVVAPPGREPTVPAAV